MLSSLISASEASYVVFLVMMDSWKFTNIHSFTSTPGKCIFMAMLADQLCK